MQALKLFLITAAIVSIDIVLLRFFNTLIWPYLWPRPAIFILIGIIVVAIVAPRYFSGIWVLRWVGATMLFVGQCYFLHSIQVALADISLPSIVHLLGFTGTMLVMLLNYVNQIAPKDNKVAPPEPAVLPFVAAVIPTYGEPVDILEQTVISLKRLDYPATHLHIFISDDGHRDEVRALAERHGVGYNQGARKDAKAGNLNSALKYLEQHFPQVTLVLTQDADEIIDPSFLRKIVGYFDDPKIAFVQTPKEAFTPNGDPFGNRDRIFYDVLQPGRNGSGAAFSCGSGVLWRIAALNTIGGFATWNIVEDMTTSYFLHCAGFRSEYHNEVLTIGLSPDDIPGMLKQRGTWAADTWRFFLFQNPLLKRAQLTLRQRLQYLELGMFYVSSTLFMPLLMLTPLLSLVTGHFIKIEGAALYPWVFFSTLYYVVLAKGNVSHLVRMWQYWLGHWPTYSKAFWIAVRARNSKPGYKVTRKTRQDGFYGGLIWPQFFYLFFSLGASIYGLFFIPAASMNQRLTNLGILAFFMFLTAGICRAAFYGTSPATFARILIDAGRAIAPVWLWAPARRLSRRLLYERFHALWLRLPFRMISPPPSSQHSGASPLPTAVQSREEA